MSVDDLTENMPSQAPAAEPAVEASPEPEETPKAPKKGGKKKQPPKKRKPKTTAQLLVGLLIKIGVIVLAVWLLFTFVLGIHIHYGNNMHPAVRDGDLIFSFRLQSPFINAAVLYSHDGKTDVGRVVAMGGSVVDISENGSLTVNGAAPAEEVFYPTFPADGSEITYPYTVEQGKVFILNDFREDVNDSRTFGAVSTGDLKGALLLTMRRRGF